MPTKHELLPPSLLNNPSWDVIVTRQDPLLSFFNTKGGPKKKTYEIQIDTSQKFNSKDLIVYKNVKEKSEFVTEKKIEKQDLLKDNKTYFWRVRAITDTGKSKWTISKFQVDTKSDAEFMGLVRAKVKNTEVSNGYNKKKHY